MSVKRLIVVCSCGCLLLLAMGCRTETGTVQQTTTTNTQSSTNTTQQTSSTPPSAANSNVAANQNTALQNSNATTTQAGQKLDPCALITSSEIASVQGEEVKETKAAPGNSSRLAVAQCFYQTATPSKSVSLEITQRLTGQPGALSPREFWRENFEHEERGGERERERKPGREKERKREAEKREARGGEEEEEGNPAVRVAGVGDEAFWASNVRAGALYVLKGDSIIRISVGGISDQNLRLEKSKALARLALKRLKD